MESQLGTPNRPIGDAYGACLLAGFAACTEWIVVEVAALILAPLQIAILQSQI